LTPRPGATANTERTIACVNACAGIADPEETVPAALKALDVLSRM